MKDDEAINKRFNAMIYSVCTLHIYTFLVFGNWLLPKWLSMSHVTKSVVLLCTHQHTYPS